MGGKEDYSALQMVIYTEYLVRVIVNSQEEPFDYLVL